MKRLLMIIPVVVFLSSAFSFAMFTKAANQGIAMAQFNLGVMYYEGQGVPQDYKQAVFWYRKASDQALATAQYNLGLSYFKGEGVPQDYVEAHKWFNIAAGYTTDDKETRDNAIQGRELVAKLMTPAQIAEAQKRASEWKKK
jgi:uncharacterized protein